jgi:hypothetical protein
MENDTAFICHKKTENNSIAIGYICGVFNTTFNDISAISLWSVLLVKETRVPGENH